MNVAWEKAVRLLPISNPAKWGSVCLLLVFPLAGLATQSDDTVRLDNSDWWSTSRSSDSGEDIKTQERELASPNFRVLGVTLGETMFSRQSWGKLRRSSAPTRRPDGGKSATRRLALKKKYISFLSKAKWDTRFISLLVVLPGKVLIAALFQTRSPEV